VLSELESLNHLLKNVKSEDSEEMEKVKLMRRPEPAEFVMHCPEMSRENFLIQNTSIDSNPFSNIYKMWGSVQSRTQTRLAQDSLCEGRR
jgi:hypothetical protein